MTYLYQDKEYSKSELRSLIGTVKMFKAENKIFASKREALDYLISKSKVIPPEPKKHYYFYVAEHDAESGKNTSYELIAEYVTNNEEDVEGVAKTCRGYARVNYQDYETQDGREIYYVIAVYVRNEKRKMELYDTYALY